MCIHEQFLAKQSRPHLKWTTSRKSVDTIDADDLSDGLVSHEATDDDDNSDCDSPVRQKRLLNVSSVMLSQQGLPSLRGRTERVQQLTDKRGFLKLTAGSDNHGLPVRQKSACKVPPLAATSYHQLIK
eukprot:scaffold444294_cov47-Prasinocladus_malaysianus.AAC.1